MIAKRLSRTMEYEYRIAERGDCGQLARTAKEIWEEHFTPIIGERQVEYMLERFQSEHALMNALEDNYRYYLVFDGDELIAYCGVQPRQHELFLSKLYVKKQHRGEGISRKLLNKAIEYAKELGTESIRLTVNKQNDHTISVYTYMGFEKIDESVTEIGNGFRMDDYIMSLSL